MPASESLCMLLCSQLRHVYRGQCFRDWWNRPERARAPERLQWMNFRKKARDLERSRAISSDLE